MQIPECVVKRFLDDIYEEYRGEIVPEVYYEDDGMYVSDGDYVSKDEFVKELDSTEIYKYIYEIAVSEDALISDLKYYFDDMMFKNDDKWYVYYTHNSEEYEMFFHDVIIRAAIKFVSGFIKIIGDSASKWDNGMIVDENNANIKFKMNARVHDSKHFRENVMMLYDKHDEKSLDDLHMMVEHAIYKHQIDDVKWTMDLFPDLFQCIYEFNYMCYLIYHDDMELFKLLLPITKTYTVCESMLKTAIKYDKQQFFTLLMHDDNECITKYVKEMLEKYNKMSWLV